MAHETYERLLLAATSIDLSANESLFAQWADTSNNTIYNWQRRGVSKDGALEIQRVSGISATWVLNGIEPMMVGGSAASQAGRVTGDIITKAVEFVTLTLRMSGQRFELERDVDLLATTVNAMLDSEGNANEAGSVGKVGAARSQQGADTKRGASGTKGGGRAGRRVA